MLLTKALPVAGAAALALGLAACGGADTDDVKSSLQDDNNAGGAKDAAKACDLLSAAAKKTIGGRSCEQTLKSGFALLNSKQLAAFKDTTIKNIKVNDDKATATISFPKGSGVPDQTQALVKEGGDWHLQAAGAK